MGGIPAPQSLGTTILGFGVRGFPPRACPRAREPFLTPKQREPPPNSLPAAPPKLRRPHAAAPRAPAARGPPRPRPFTLYHAPFPLIGQRLRPAPSRCPGDRAAPPRMNGGVPSSVCDVIADVMCRPMGGGGAGLRGKQTPHVAAAGRGTRAGGGHGGGGGTASGPPPVPPGARGAPTRAAPPRPSTGCPVPVAPVPLIGTPRTRRVPLRSP